MADDAPSILDEAMDWWMGNDELSTKLEEFAMKSCGKFPDQPEDGSIPEQTTEHMELFQSFQEILEGELEGWLKEKGIATDEFYEQCRIAQEKSEKDPDGEEAGNVGILQWILSLTDYPMFYQMMIDAKKN
eukprot:Hpha_TRINITY_DN12251_c0_g1::TRINITY_DN12251_c0_g1_i1::g.17159::m.17159